MSTRRLRSLGRRARVGVVALASALAVLVLGGLPTTALEAAAGSCFVDDTMVCVEVPDVRFEVLDDAMLILEDVGLVALAPPGAALERIVSSQRPGPGALVLPGSVVRVDLVPLPTTTATPTTPPTTPPTTLPPTTPPTTSPTTSPPPTRTTASVPEATTSRPTTAPSTRPTTPPPSSGPSSAPATTVAGTTTVTTVAGATTTTSAGATTTTTGSSGPPTAPGPPPPPSRPAFDPVAFVARHARGGAPVLVALVGSLLVRRRRRPPRRTRRPGLPLVARFGAQGRLMGSTGGEGGLIARFASRPPLDPGAPDDHHPE